MIPSIQENVYAILLGRRLLDKQERIQASTSPSIGSPDPLLGIAPLHPPIMNANNPNTPHDNAQPTQALQGNLDPLVFVIPIPRVP